MLEQNRRRLPLHRGQPQYKTPRFFSIEAEKINTLQQLGLPEQAHRSSNLEETSWQMTSRLPHHLPILSRRQCCLLYHIFDELLHCKSKSNEEPNAEHLEISSLTKFMKQEILINQKFIGF